MATSEQSATVAGRLRHRDDCRLCGGTDLELVVPLAPTAIADAYVSDPDEQQETYPLDLYFCRGCSHVQLLDVVDPRLMFKTDYSYATGGSAGIVKHFREYAESVIEKESLEPDSLVVEIGSNDGTLLKFFKEAGMDVLGVDPAARLAERARAAGVETIPRFLSLELAREIRQQRGGARIVTANNVFAHADDLGGMADSIRTLMADDGLFAFEVSYLVDVVDRMLLGTIFHEHLCYHAVKPMRGFLARHALELVDVERVGIQGGSIIGYAQIAGGPREVSSRVHELARMEEERGFDREETFRAFSDRIDSMKTEFEDVLGTMQSKGKTLAGYGAARGGTLLISHFGLARYLEYLVDDSPSKIGLYSPGDHLPIFASDALYKRRPDVVMILAWVHHKAIIENHRRYLDEGGQFVVAYPHMEVVSGAG